MAGTLELRQAIVAWLNRRYRLPAGALDPDRNVLTLAGTKEGLYLFSSLVVPREKAGRQPIVLVPNPYYLVYNGAATMAGAEAVFLDATRDNRFMPDLAAIPVPLFHIAPAAAAVLFGLALIYRDGALVIVAAVAAVLSIVVDALVIGSGVVALSYAASWLHL